MIQVWQDKEPRWSDSRSGTVRAFSPENFEQVATVDASGLADAYKATNSIDDYWWLNANVTKLGDAPGYRSTSVGDVMVKDGVAWRVASIGYEEVWEGREEGGTE